MRSVAAADDFPDAFAELATQWPDASHGLQLESPDACFRQALAIVGGAVAAMPSSTGRDHAGARCAEVPGDDRHRLGVRKGPSRPPL